MTIFITNQEKHFRKHLGKLKNSPAIPYDRKLLTHKRASRKIARLFSDIPFNILFNYKIFPERILQAYPEWILESREMQPGDTIVQQINIPPLHEISLRLITGVRIKEVFNSEVCKGFSYETLKGHVEEGISTFKIEPNNGYSAFTIETYSKPAFALLRIFRPLSSYYQNYCTDKALANVVKRCVGSSDV